ncbi:type IV secretion system DotC family protein [Enterobacteriaceae bacterium H16N7]|nr:type IV secretion system DotC family protein [Dryocola clanedunensis]
MTLTQLSLCLALVLPAAALATSAPPPPDIDDFINPQSVNKHGLNDTQWQLLTDAGQTVGFRGGKAQRAWELRQSLNARAATLEKMYTFAPLINRQGWLPPVITAAQSLAHITPGQIRTANKVYDILVPERFVSNPPGWRQYLLAGLSSDAVVPTEIRPKNSDEEAVWKEAVEKGWLEGRESADRTLESNLNRLSRDYTGMIQYLTLVQQGMVTAPVVSEALQTVTGRRDQLTLGDRTRRLDKHAGFELDKKRWKPTISVSH